MSPRSNAFDLERYLQIRRQDIEIALEFLPVEGVPAGLHEPIEYAIGVGGKRLRPVFCVATFQAVTGTERPTPDIHRAASALELIHAYSLVHDDLPFMDDDDVRRGRPTTHRAFGTASATVAGVAMIVVAFRMLENAMASLGSTPEIRSAAIAQLAAASGAPGMVGGQWLDLAAEGRVLPRAELEQVHALKTGALIRAAVVIGGILAGATPEQRDALARYGSSIGLAFQITDDLLDARGDSAAIGKTAGRDAALAKSTYPRLLGIHGAERLAREQVETGLAALEAQGLRSPALEALARFSVERDS